MKKEDTYNYEAEHSDAVFLTKISFTLAAIAGFLLNLKGMLTIACFLFAMIFAYYTTKHLVTPYNYLNC